MSGPTTRARRRLAAAGLLAGGALVAGPAPALGQGRTHLVVVAGVGGDPKYVEAFGGAGAALVRAAGERHGVAEADIVFLAERAPAGARSDGTSSRANVEQALAQVAGRAGAGDQLVVVLIGHGSSQNDVARFNLVGPDLTAGEWAALLKKVPARRVAFVNASSASGDFVKPLAAPGRVIVTATKSGTERNESQFYRHFVDALAGDGADADKDGRVSLLEAFDYARREVVRAYERENRLLTEHAQLDDDGDGAAAAEPGGKSRDGALARAFFLGAGTGAAAVAASDPRAAPLLAEKAKWEARVDSLRRAKDTMDAATYERALEEALVGLARANQSIRDMQGKKP